MAGKKDITVEQGATWTASFTWKNAAGTPINLTGATAKLVIYSDDSSSPVTTLTNSPAIVITALSGKIDVTISDTVTDPFLWSKGNWYLDVTLSNGQVRRLVKGDFAVEPKKTKR
jgi:hypothetical protein